MKTKEDVEQGVGIVIIRIGKCYNPQTTEIKYQLQFKTTGMIRYDGFSVDTFENEKEAKEAIKSHCSGERVYKPFATLGGMSRYVMFKAY